MGAQTSLEVKKTEERKGQGLRRKEKEDSLSEDSSGEQEEQGFKVKNETIITQKDFKSASGSSPFQNKAEANVIENEGFTDLRKQIKSVKANTIESSQGQLCVIINQERLVGSGTLCCIEISSQRFIITCAHNFIRRSLLNKEKKYTAESASYHLGKVGEKKYLKESVVRSFYIHPGYDDNPDPLDGCDFAVGLLKEDFTFASMPDESYLSYVEKESPVVGDIIRVIGYPGEKNGCLYEMTGTIQQIIRTGENQIILYDDINTSAGQSGSPVYLKRGNRWALIGVHVAGLKDDKVNVATGITAGIYKWIESRLKSIYDPIKIVMVGKTPLKTDLFQSYREGRYMSGQGVGPVLGSDFAQRVISINERNVPLKIVDTMEVERALSSTVLFLKGCDAPIFIYDMADESDLEEIKGRVYYCLRGEYLDKNSKIYLVGNRDRLGKGEDGLLEEGKLFAAEIRATFLIISSKINEEVKEFFQTIGKDVIESRSRRRREEKW